MSVVKRKAKCGTLVMVTICRVTISDGIESHFRRLGGFQGWISGALLMICCHEDGEMCYFFNIILLLFVYHLLLFEAC